MQEADLSDQRGKFGFLKNFRLFDFKEKNSTSEAKLSAPSHPPSIENLSDPMRSACIPVFAMQRLVMDFGAVAALSLARRTYPM